MQMSDTVLTSSSRAITSDENLGSMTPGGNVRRLSQKFENLREKTPSISKEQLSQASRQENETTTALNSLSNRDILRILKQILVGGSIGVLTGSLLGQANLAAKLAGLLTTTIFAGEHVANFASWTSFNLGKLENSNPKESYSSSNRLSTNIDNFFTDNMPTIVSFLFASALSTAITVRSRNDCLPDVPLICQTPLLVEQSPQPILFPCPCSCHYPLPSPIQYNPLPPSDNNDQLFALSGY